MNLGDIISDEEWSATQAQMAGGKTILPAGIYQAVVWDATLSPTKSGEGIKLITKHTITDGPYEGEVVDHLFNVKNPNPTAQQIGKGELKTLSLAVGLTDRPEHESELMDKPHLIKVIVEESDQINPNTGEWYKNNRIKGFYDLKSPPKERHEKAKAMVERRDAIKEQAKAVEAAFDDDDNIPF